MKNARLLKNLDTILYSLSSIIALVGLFGWFTGELSFARFFPVYIPIAPATSISFIFLSLVSIFLKNVKQSTLLIQLASSIFFVFFFYVILEWALNLPWDIESVFVSAPDLLGQVKTGRMSPITAILFIIQYFTFILFYSAKKKRVINIIWVSIVTSLYASIVLLIGYIYDEPLLYGGTIIPVALPTAICFFLISISQLNFVSFKPIPLPFSTLTPSANKLISAFLPVVIAIVFIEGLLNAKDFILFNPALDSALMLLLFIPITIYLIIMVSKGLGNSLEKAKNSLIKTKDELKRVQEITQTGSWYLNIATNEVTWTEELYKMFGIEPILPVPSFNKQLNLFTEESWELLSTSITETINSGVSFEIELNTIKKTGNNGWIWLSGTADKDKKGNTVGIWGAAQDITYDKQREMELIAAKEKAEVNEKELLKNKFLLNETGHMAKVGGWEIDLFGNTLAWTDETFKIHELSPDNQPNVEEAINFYYSDDQEMVSMMVDNAIRNEQPFDFEARLITAKGNLKWVKASGIPVTKQGKTVGIRGSIQDISKQKETEIELTKAKEKAEEADKLKSAFLANMSHEIRTPMNGILGFTNLLQEPDLTGEQQQQYVEIIKKSGERMLNTVNDIIEISKIETGQIKVSTTNVNISNHLMTLHEFFSLEAEKKGLKLILNNKLTEDESLIVTDKSKLSSILTNLIKNALKFTKQGTIEIGSKRNADLLEFYVKDTGIGIPIARKEAIFNRFEQADIEDKEVHEGSGLGLAIVKSYVEMLGGSIWVESEVDKGSTFYFTISFKPAEPVTKNKNSVQNSVTYNANNLNVLVVEDDDIGAFYLLTILKEKADNIQIAKDGLKAVEMCKNNSNFDLVLMDIKLPKLDGLEATKRIREFNKEVKIIAQTAHALEGDMEKAIKAGCDDYISKPINKERLIELFEKVLQRK